MKCFAGGCAFNLRDLAYNFNWNKINCKLIDIYGYKEHKTLFLASMFLDHLIEVVDDIIDRNVTFILPLNGRKKATIHPIAYRDKKFQYYRKFGRFKNVDFLESNFTAYRLGFQMYSTDRTPREKILYLSGEQKRRLEENTSKGMNYGCSKIDTTVNDYLESAQQKRPYLTIKEVKTILVYMWKQVYLHNSYGGDLYTFKGDNWYYFGSPSSGLRFVEYYKFKLKVKIRVLMKRYKRPYTGYYYFWITKERYEDITKGKGKRGRPKTNINFGNIKMYKSYEECRLSTLNEIYIYKYPVIIPNGWTLYYPELKTNRAEFVEMLPKRSFQDILKQNYKYKYI